MIRKIMLSALLLCATLQASEAVTLPSGAYCSISNHNKIICSGSGFRGFETVFTGKYSARPSQSTAEIGSLMAAPDGKTLYFQAQAWATADAIHSFDIVTRKSRFITSGNLVCVVLAGQYKDDLVINEHRYFIQGGSYNPTYLFSPVGKKVGIVANSYAKIPKGKYCIMLGANM